MNFTPIVAIVSGLIGALFSAYLSYVVRLRAKSREDAEERKRLAHVNFLLLTNAVAADFFITDFSERMMKLNSVKTEGYSLSHVAATFFATKIAEMKPEDMSHIQMLLKPFVRSVIESTEAFEIGQSDLGRMQEVTVYTYYRYQAAAGRLKTAMDLLDEFFGKGDVKLFDASIIHSMFRAYRDCADAAGVLRAALQNSAELSNNYSVNCLNRSFTAIKADVAASFEHNIKLDLAKKAAEAAKSPSAAAQGATVDNVPS